MAVTDFITQVDDVDLVEFRVRRMESGRIGLFFPYGFRAEFFDDLDPLYDRLRDLSRNGWYGQPMIVDDDVGEVNLRMMNRIGNCGTPIGEVQFRN